MLEKKRIEIERRMNPKGEKEILGIEGDVVSCLEIPLESVLGKDISFIRRILSNCLLSMNHGKEDEKKR